MLTSLIMALALLMMVFFIKKQIVQPEQIEAIEQQIDLLENIPAQGPKKIPSEQTGSDSKK